MGWQSRFWGKRASSVDEWAARGAELARVGRLREAAETFQEGIQHHPLSGVLWQNRGAMLGMMKQYAAALECFERASELEPRQIRHWRNKSAMLGLLGRHREALNAADQGLRLDSTDANLLESQRAALQALGEWKSAQARSKPVISGQVKAFVQLPTKKERAPAPSKPMMSESSAAKQALAMGLLAGAMRDGNLESLENLVVYLVEDQTENLEILYELAREKHPDLPSYQELNDRMDDAETEEILAAQQQKSVSNNKDSDLTEELNSPDSTEEASADETLSHTLEGLLINDFKRAFMAGEVLPIVKTGFGWNYVKAGRGRRHLLVGGSLSKPVERAGRYRCG